MSVKNIGGDPNDPHYRYKRNVIETSFNSKKGGQTTITNLARICKQLKVPYESFSLSFFKLAKKKYGLTVQDGDVIRGKVDIANLEKVLEEMIVKYVLCPRCKLPEWNRKDCKACGYSKESSGEGNVTSERVCEQVETVILSSDGVLSQAVNLMKDLYDLRSTLQDKTEVDSVIDLFWTIDESNDKLHEKWITRAATYF
jgi:translation initiation factor 2 beta subunit (eIF-2beta)/eIF-5